MRDRRGFTLLEITLVVALSATLLGVAWAAMGRARASYAVRASRTAFAGLAARARATAVERGHRIRLELDADGDSAWVVDGTEVIEVLRFGATADVEVEPTLVQCFGPRGVATPPCGSVPDPVVVRFTRDGRWAEGMLLPLGQFLPGPQGS